MHLNVTGNQPQSLFCVINLIIQIDISHDTTWIYCSPPCRFEQFASHPYTLGKDHINVSIDNCIIHLAPQNIFAGDMSMSSMNAGRSTIITHCVGNGGQSLLPI